MPEVLPQLREQPLPPPELQPNPQSRRSLLPLPKPPRQPEPRLLELEPLELEPQEPALHVPEPRPAPQPRALGLPATAQPGWPAQPERPARLHLLSQPASQPDAELPAEEPQQPSASPVFPQLSSELLPVLPVLPPADAQSQAPSVVGSQWREVVPEQQCSRPAGGGERCGAAREPPP